LVDERVAVEAMKFVAGDHWQRVRLPAFFSSRPMIVSRRLPHTSLREYAALRVAVKPMACTDYFLRSSRSWAAPIRERATVAPLELLERSFDRGLQQVEPELSTPSAVVGSKILLGLWD
jgi:hypothetical protein